jgi:hypothetical protein
LAINFPLSTAFDVSCVLVSGAFIFIKFQELFDSPPYFFDDPLLMEQCVVQSPGVWVFSAVSFVLVF